jgi:hypothetical protein
VIYNPDGDPNEFDPNDLDAVVAYLDNPTVKALHEDIGRAFSDLSAAEQIDELAPELVRAEARRDGLAAALTDAPHDDPRRVLLDALSDHIASMQARIAELRDKPLI